MIDLMDRDPTLAVAASAPDAEAHGDALPRGTHVDGYLIVELIGQGGMGRVYAAYDPSLDRKIALKLLRSEQLSATTVADGHHRLLREARALAKLSHPNVVALYDAGTFGAVCPAHRRSRGPGTIAPGVA